MSTRTLINAHMNGNPGGHPEIPRIVHRSQTTLVSAQVPDPRPGASPAAHNLTHIKPTTLPAITASIPPTTIYTIGTTHMIFQFFHCTATA